MLGIEFLAAQTLRFDMLGMVSPGSLRVFRFKFGKVGTSPMIPNH